MKIDFFKDDCQEKSLSVSVFGLCDDQDGSRAYTSLINPEVWTATVKNERNLDIVFTAIDKCLIKDHELRGQGRCDGMLFSYEHLYFVELKEQQSNWLPDALAQLESTIVLFMENHNILDFKYRKAFACNKRHRGFKQIDNEQNLRFFRKYGVRLDLQTNLVVL